jgi:predicted nuclease with TOPRIM domain
MVDDNHPRLQRFMELAGLESNLATQRLKVMEEYLDATAGLDHDEPLRGGLERLHSRLRRISTEHDVVLAKVAAELDDRVDELGPQLADEVENMLRAASS